MKTWLISTFLVLTMLVLSPESFAQTPWPGASECSGQVVIVPLDGEHIHNLDEVHSVFINSLELSDYYGRNLDALYAALLEVNCPTQILIKRGLILQKNLGPETWQSFFKTIADAIDLNANLVLEYWD